MWSRTATLPWPCCSTPAAAWRSACWLSSSRPERPASPVVKPFSLAFGRCVRREAALSGSNSGQMIQVPNTLRLKVGGRLGGIDPAAIAKAEAALKSLSGNFAEWLQDEVTKLEAARQRIKTEGLTAEATEGLYLRAHDLKGLGATYEY